MHTVEMLESALDLAGKLGYRVRQDWLGGALGGACEVRGQKWLLLDCDSSPAEQLDLVLRALQQEPNLVQFDIPAPLARQFSLRQAA